MVQWISTKLGTQVILTKIWHPIDFQGQTSRSQLNFELFSGLTARGYATFCVALVCIGYTSYKRVYMSNAMCREFILSLSTESTVLMHTVCVCLSYSPLVSSLL
jgi:hypothetical protein